MKTRLLVDASWVFFVKFQSGEPLRFIGTINYLANKFTPNICCIWDDPLVVPKRRGILPSYKADRPEKEKAFIDALRDVQARLKRGAVKQYVSDWEGDDVIYTLSRDENYHNIIYAADKDFYPAVSKSCSFHRCGVGKDSVDSYVTIDDIESTPVKIGNEYLFGVTPTIARDMLILMGDKCDGVPGIPGCGPKYSFELVSSVPNVIDRVIEGDKESVYKDATKSLYFKKTCRFLNYMFDNTDHVRILRSVISLRVVKYWEV